MSDHALPLIDVMSRRLGPPRERTGGGRGRPWWTCPFHPDRNPSLTIRPDGARWRCFGCNASGDAIELIRRLEPGISFGEARAKAGGSVAWRRGRPASAPHRAGGGTSPSPRPPGWLAFADEVVRKAAARLWGPGGAEARDYLNGRGLGDATIRAVNLGWNAEDRWHRGLYDGAVMVPAGITIPWMEAGTVSAVNVRRLAGAGRKYHLLKGSRRCLYPGRSALHAGRPLIIVEGELDALLLAQEVGALASVVTMGSASDRRPAPSLLMALAACSPWYVSGDGDGAGEANAEEWLARSGRCRRVRPPAVKDWTDAHLDGYQLGDWWAEMLAGRDPARFDPAWYAPSPVSSA